LAPNSKTGTQTEINFGGMVSNLSPLNVAFVAMAVPFLFIVGRALKPIHLRTTSDLDFAGSLGRMALICGVWALLIIAGTHLSPGPTDNSPTATLALRN
jgi:hypothetical protein